MVPNTYSKYDISRSVKEMPFQTLQKNYDWEVEAFERHLEKVYRLCFSCQTRVQQELQIQNEAISKRLHNSNVSAESFSSTKIQNSFQKVCF